MGLRTQDQQQEKWLFLTHWREMSRFHGMGFLASLVSRLRCFRSCGGSCFLNIQLHLDRDLVILPGKKIKTIIKEKNYDIGEKKFPLKPMSLDQETTLQITPKVISGSLRKQGSSAVICECRLCCKCSN